MSNQSKLSVEEEMRAVISRAQSEGRANEVLQVISNSFSAPKHDCQGMADSSKRLRSDHDDQEWIVTSDAAGSSAASTSQMPAFTHSQGRVPRGANGKPLPAGITSAHQWGRTLCTLPKVKAKNASYDELIIMSETDEALKQYLTKFIMCHNGPSTKVKDLRAYLEYLGYPNHRGEPRLYMDSAQSVERTFKN